MEENSPQGIWDHIADKMLLEFAESGCPIFRATTPLSRGKLKSKGHGKLSIHFAADQETIDTIFSHNCFCQSAQSSSCKLMDNQLFSVKSRQKFLRRMTSHHTRIFYCNAMKNESNCFHKKTK